MPFSFLGFLQIIIPKYNYLPGNNPFFVRFSPNVPQVKSFRGLNYLNIEMTADYKPSKYVFILLEHI